MTDRQDRQTDRPTDRQTDRQRSDSIGRTVFTARRSYASAVFGVVNSVRLSVRPSVTRVLCDKSKDHIGDIFTPHEMVNPSTACPRKTAS